MTCFAHSPRTAGSSGSVSEWFYQSKGRASVAVGHQHRAEALAADWQGAGRVRRENAQRLFGKRSKVAATLDDLADHVDHEVKIAGIDHVGIGSDLDGISGTVNGLEDVSKMPALVAVLTGLPVIQPQCAPTS